MLRAGLGWYFGFHPFDDTYITFRYALNIAHGNGFVYNLNEPVLGTTTPLWTLVLALCSFLKLPLAGSALASSLLADVVSALLMARILLRLGFYPVIAGSAAILFLCCFDYFSLARSGMETSVFVLLILATLHQCAARRFLFAGLWCGLACVTRPEGSILVLVLLLSLWLHRKSWRDNGAVSGLGLLVMCGAGWGLFAVTTFGSVIPQSIVAKSFAVHTDPRLAHLSWQNLGTFFWNGQPSDGLLAPAWLQFNLAWTLLSLLALLRLLASCFRRPSIQNIERVFLLLIFPVCYVSGLAFSHAFTWFPWYYGPIYPFYAILTAVGASFLLERLPLKVKQAQVCLGTLAAALLVCQMLAAVLVKLPNDRSFWVKGYFQVAGAIPHDSHTRVAAFEIGAVGWRIWPASVLDVTGLVTPGAVGVRPDLFIQSSRPDYIVLTTDDAVDFLSRASVQSWFFDRYEPVVVIRDPYGDREYRTYRRIP